MVTCCVRQTLFNLLADEYIDDWFWTRNGINPYRGCEHACEYCDGRSQKYHVENFDEKIQVKINAPELLERELRKAGYARNAIEKTASIF